MNPALHEVKTKYAAGCREVAAHYLQISDQLQATDPEFARFALDRAIENHNQAQKEEYAINEN